MNESIVEASWSAGARSVVSFSSKGFSCELLDCQWPQQKVADLVLGEHVLWMSLTRPRLKRMHIDGIRDVVFKTGNINLLPANIRIHTESEEGDQRLLVCRISPEKLSQVFGENLDAGKTLASIHLNLSCPRISESLFRIKTELDFQGFGSAQLLEALGTCLTVDAGRFLHRRIEVRQKGGLASWQIRRIEDYLDECPAASLEDLASLCGLSSRHLMRAYRQSTGETVHQRVAEKQLAKAKTLLVDTDLSLKAIALMLGFKHPSAFSNGFRRAMQQSPREYRQRYRG